MIRPLAAALLALLGATAGAAEGGNVVDVLRARVATLPVLVASAEAGSPTFTVVRFNEAAIITGGERYGAVRLVCPPGKPLSLAWMFSDIGNIDEYEFAPVRGGAVETASIRQIYPATAAADVDQERPGRRASSLPRPWDLFELHMLAVPARLLQPGGEYLIWFRFSDRRPVDVLLAATFVDPAARLEPADLPAIFALPILGAP